MNGPHDKLDFVPDPSAMTGSEDMMARRIEEDGILEYREEEVREAAHKKLWTQFQQTAAALTQLYRDQPGRDGPSPRDGAGPRDGGAGPRDGPAYRDQPSSRDQHGAAWQPFQTAAGSLTLLYRDSLEEQRLVGDVNRKLGYHRARRDILTWAKSRRRFIRREELLSFLVQCSPGQSVSPLESTFETGLSFRGAPAPAPAPTPLPSLQDMLELSRLEGVERYKRPAPSSPSSDENMDSPSSKRSRFN